MILAFVLGKPSKISFTKMEFSISVWTPVRLAERWRKKRAQICAEGCEGGQHLVHIGIIWQNVFNCPIWPIG